MGHHLLAICLVLALGLPAAAADVEGSVRLKTATGEAVPSGQPIIVYLTGFKQPPPAESPVIAQKDKIFTPNLRIIVAGQSVQFTNEDPVVHNVFSTSTARSFDLGKPGPQQTREVNFPTPGLVDVYCNIHETMFASVLVFSPELRKCGSIEVARTFWPSVRVSARRPDPGSSKATARTRARRSIGVTSDREDDIRLPHPSGQFVNQADVLSKPRRHASLKRLMENPECPSLPMKKTQYSAVCPA